LDPNHNPDPRQNVLDLQRDVEDVSTIKNFSNRRKGWQHYWYRFLKILLDISWIRDKHTRSAPLLYAKKTSHATANGRAIPKYRYCTKALWNLGLDLPAACGLMVCGNVEHIE
jgi:hypothetical protein